MAALIIAVRQSEEERAVLMVDLSVFHPNSGPFQVYSVPFGEAAKDAKLNSIWMWPELNEWELEEKKRADTLHAVKEAARSVAKHEATERHLENQIVGEKYVSR